MAMCDTGASSSVLPYRLAKQLGLRIDTRGPPLFIRNANNQRVQCTGTASMYCRHPHSKYWRIVNFLVVRGAQVLLLSNRDLKSLRLLHQKYPYFWGDLEPTPEDIYTVSTDGGNDNNISDKDNIGSASTDTHTVGVRQCQSVSVETHTPMS